MISRIAHLLLRFRIALLVLAVVIACVSYGPSRQVEFDRSIENMFSPDDPLLGPYQDLKHTFGGNEVVLAVFTDAELMNPDKSGIRRLAEISKQMRSIEGVKGVLSLDSLLGESIVEDNEVAKRMRQLFAKYTHGDDLQTVALVCMLAPGQGERRATAINEIREVVQSTPNGSGVVAGEPVMVEEGFRYIQDDGSRLGLWSSLLLAIVIVVSFRSLRWVIIPLAVVQFTVLLTRATLVWSGLRMSMVSSLLTAIVTVVGVATVMHIVVRFRDLRGGGLTRPEALLETVKLLAVPVSLACITDAVGFAALLVADVGPVRDFGLMMAIGSLLVLVAVGLLVPAMALVGTKPGDPRNVWGEHKLDAWLAAPLRWSRRHRGIVAATIVSVVAVAIAGLPRLRVETDFTKNFRRSSPIVKAYRFVEQDLGGAGVLDIVLPAPQQLDWQFLSRVLKLEQRLRNEVVVTTGDTASVAGLTKVLSLADAIVAGSPVDLAAIPIDAVRDGLVTAGLRTMQAKLPVFYDALYSETDDGNYYRIMLRAKEQQPADQKLRLIADVQRICLEEFPATEDDSGGEVTGFFVLLTNLVRSMIRDQWLTFGVATAAIGLMMLLAFRSPTLALIALIPNTLPIVLLLGTMGWLGTPINMGAAMIAAVSMGLSIDGSIHYLTFFRRSLAKTGDAMQAMNEVQQSVGRALVFATLALIVGFSVLCTSDFVPTIFFGGLVSLSMLGGLLGNLVLLPLMLGSAYR